MIRFARPDGGRCPGYLATPSGFRALVPDLFRGKVASNSDEGSHLMSSLNFGDAASQDIRGASQFLKEKSKKAATLGFCMGGALTIISAVHLPDVDAGAVYRYDAEHAFMNERGRRCTTRRRQSSRGNGASIF